MGAAFDVVITVPALYLLLIVRAGLQPAISVAPLCLLGLLRATYLAPGAAMARPAIAGAVEIAVTWILIARVCRGMRAAGGGDLVERMERGAREIVPLDRAASVLAGELAVFWYAFASWRRTREVPPGARAFTLHEQSGAATLLGFLAGVSLMEAALVHLIIARWSVTVAWVLTAVSIYGAVWLGAVARSFRVRPMLVTENEVVVRAGLLWTVRIPRDAVAIESAVSTYDLKVPLLAEPNVVLRLRTPRIAYGIYGLRRRVSTIAIQVDDASAFRSVLNW